MKPDKIDWIRNETYFMVFPQEDRTLLLSYNNSFGFGDTRNKITEGIWKLYGHPSGFVDKDNKQVIGVYAWAYKPIIIEEIRERILAVTMDDQNMLPERIDSDQANAMDFRTVFARLMRQKLLNL